MRLSALVSAVLVAVTATSAALAQEPSRLDRILEKGILRVGTTGDYKPFTYRDPATGQFSGLDIDLAQNLGQAMGVKVEFVPTSWPNLMKDFEANAFDVGVGGVSITLDRQKKAFFSSALFREGKTPITRCENKDRFQTLEEIDRPGVKAIVNPGGTNERFAKARLKQAEILTFPDNTRIFEEIVAGRADLMMTDAAETRFQQRLHPGVLCAVHPDKPFDFAEKAYLLPRDIDLKQFVDAWLHIARETGSFDATVKKWID